MKDGEIEFIPGGTITSPEGFHAGATYARIKQAEDSLDLGILFSEVPCTVAGLFTTSRIKSAPVKLNQEKLKRDRSQAVVANSGCANAYTGEQGITDAKSMAALAANGLGISPEDVMVASTGVTGQLLPMEKIKAGISRIVLSNDSGHELARAIMTTDTVPKETAVSVNAGGISFTIGGVAKGSGMIHPDLATMFCFLTTDAAVESDFLKSALRKAVDISLNMISIDRDTSPSDTVLLLANGKAGNELIMAGSEQADAFQQTLNQVCIYFAKVLARDGEGATRLIEATVSGAANDTEAKAAAKAVISSILVKTAVHGGDPNWGRIIMAVGQSGIEVNESNINLSIGDIPLLKSGKPLSFDEKRAAAILNQDEVPVTVNLNLGTGTATAWGCDLSEEYVTINSQYRT